MLVPLLIWMKWFFVHSLPPAITIPASETQVICPRMLCPYELPYWFLENAIENERVHQKRSIIKEEVSSLNSCGLQHL